MPASVLTYTIITKQITRHWSLLIDLYPNFLKKLFCKAIFLYSFIKNKSWLSSNETTRLCPEWDIHKVLQNLNINNTDVHDGISDRMFNHLSIRSSNHCECLQPGLLDTAQKMQFSIMDLFSKCDQIFRKLWIWSHLLKESLMKNFIFLCSGKR